MKDPPADAVMPEPSFAPKTEPVVTEAPCAQAKVEKPKHKSKPKPKPKPKSCDCDEEE
jgi:outer membrane biosynthesis protein TonB